MWNLILDPLLQDLQNIGEYVQAFADDIVLIAEGETGSEIQQKLNLTLNRIHRWGILNKLKFAPHKTKAMVVTRKLKYDTPRLNMNNVPIQMDNHIRILGVDLDARLTFNRHVERVCRKGIQIYKQLAKAAKIEWGLNQQVIATTYTAIIEPIVMYAAAVWAPATKKICIQKKLNHLQRGFALKIAKTYRTTSLHAATLLAGILPLDLRIQEAAALYEIKRGVSAEILKEGEELEKRVKYVDLPHPAKQTKLDYKMLTNPEEIARHGGTQIYTDGSKTSTGVGAAWTEWKDGMEINSKKMKMAPHCTVFQAELMALRNATRHIDKNKRDAKIYSDSKSALDAIVSGRSLDPQVAEIRRSLEECRKTGTHVSLFWVKAHVGTPGNERADTLAKEASEKLSSEPEYAAYPLSYIKHQIRQRTLEVWNERYLGGETAGTTKLFIGNVKTAYKLVKGKRFTPQMAQILTGHGAFAYYLHRFKIRTSPTCSCSNEEQTVEHVLLHCPIFASSRHDLEQQIRITVDRNGLQDILMKHRPCLERFCEKIVVYIKEANKTDRAGLAGNCTPARP